MAIEKCKCGARLIAGPSGLSCEAMCGARIWPIHDGIRQEYIKAGQFMLEAGTCKCGGSGELPCPGCDGSGESECQDCDGSGDCFECGHAHGCTSCDGEGTDTCADCDGDGVVTCVCKL